MRVLLLVVSLAMVSEFVVVAAKDSKPKTLVSKSEVSKSFRQMDINRDSALQSEEVKEGFLKSVAGSALANASSFQTFLTVFMVPHHYRAN